MAEFTASRVFIGGSRNLVLSTPSENVLGIEGPTVRLFGSVIVDFGFTSDAGGSWTIDKPERPSTLFRFGDIDRICTNLDGQVLVGSTYNVLLGAER